MKTFTQFLEMQTREWDSWFLKFTQAVKAIAAASQATDVSAAVNSGTELYTLSVNIADRSPEALGNRWGTLGAPMIAAVMNGLQSSSATLAQLAGQLRTNPGRFANYGAQQQGMAWRPDPNALPQAVRQLENLADRLDNEWQGWHQVYRQLGGR